ncbi:MAG: M1 family metallopeptidase, partial [Candidatus Hydrothermae bacterium]|nr:M1 family metallopeptidase [Candidatus Hydrothermae bacterium]
MNRSPDTLRYIWFHLYPLAFRPGSVFDREAREAGNFRLARSDSAAWTRWTWQRVEAGGMPCDSGGSTACRMQRVDTELRLILPEPLAPGDTCRFVFAYTLRLPRIFSRMGRQGRDMVITQWYPKPAVYDAVPPKHPPLDLPDSLYQGRTGFWHPDGYHYQGEFYGEFGSFRVRINVPEAYTVAATGLQVTADTLRDSTGTRIRRVYHADSVHDFAWVASPDWVVMDTMYRQIHLVIYAKKHRQSLYDTLRQELPRMFERLETWYGPYPYPVFRVVDGPLAAGGGMEYPMLVIVAPPHGFKRLYGLVGFTRMERLRTVTVHELAHQWFYGILANNELDEPWLDESWTSDAEKR